MKVMRDFMRAAVADVGEGFVDAVAKFGGHELLSVKVHYANISSYYE